MNLCSVQSADGIAHDRKPCMMEMCNDSHFKQRLMQGVFMNQHKPQRHQNLNISAAAPMSEEAIAWVL
ncbi:MAG: hypothetical protein D6742_20625 [Cyanobacteria bacterium J069]|nr:MAG: hypothetical protein D6742_20625 [Cyanobacteria bacterium J069]